MSTLGKKCIEMYPDHVPLIIDKLNDTFINKKLLIQRNIDSIQIINMVRTKFNINSLDNVRIFLTYASTEIPNHLTIDSMYTLHKKADDCLHISVRTISRK